MLRIKTKGQTPHATRVTMTPTVAALIGAKLVSLLRSQRRIGSAYNELSIVVENGWQTPGLSHADIWTLRLNSSGFVCSLRDRRLLVVLLAMINLTWIAAHESIRSAGHRLGRVFSRLTKRGD
jgi:hypothetical protein